MDIIGDADFARREADKAFAEDALDEIERTFDHLIHRNMTKSDNAAADSDDGTIEQEARILRAARRQAVENWQKRRAG